MLLDRGGLSLDATPELLRGRTLADELLTPTRIYARDCLALAAEAGAHAFAHITGGGLAGNLVRVLPPDVDAEVDMNIIMDSAGRFIEVQGCAEHGAFTRAQMDAMMSLAEQGVRDLLAAQRKALSNGQVLGGKSP